MGSNGKRRGYLKAQSVNWSFVFCRLSTLLNVGGLGCAGTGTAPLHSVRVCLRAHFVIFPPLLTAKFPCCIPGESSTLLLSELCSFRPEPFTFSELGSGQW